MRAAEGTTRTNYSHQELIHIRFMNHYEIDERAAQYAAHLLLGPATRTLIALRDAANANSDGWAYWPKPTRAAARLMELIERDGTARWRFERERADVTLTEVKAALRPIKAFRTRSGLQFQDLRTCGEERILKAWPATRGS